VAVCSIEKANVALNKMLSEGRVGELAAVVVDEVHMVTDPHRCPDCADCGGSVLECGLTMGDG
jgi:replicative superfamily II helicase